MFRNTAPRQVRLADCRQITAPEQLEAGSLIARVSIWRGTTPSERLTRAGFALTGILRDEGESILSSTRRAWKFEDLHGIHSDWRGVVEWRNRDGVTVRKTGAAPQDELAAYMDKDPAELPDIEPIPAFYPFTDLGLTALSDGRWSFAATLDLNRDRAS